MKKICCIIALFVPYIFLCCNSEEQPVDYVDPFIGTGFHGHTYPGATMPFGAVQVSPDTRFNDWDACSGYHYSDSLIYGFSQTHLSGTGCIDLGDILFRPTVSRVNFNHKRIYEPATFSHKYEKASPGFYSVKLLNENIDVELTATTHCAYHKYSYPKNSDSLKIIVDLSSTLTTDDKVLYSQLSIDGKKEISGGRVTSGWVENQHIYFASEFSEPIAKYEFISDGRIVNDSLSLTSKNLLLVLYFNDISKKTIYAKVGISSVSEDNALQNLKSEIGNNTFESISEKARETWNKELSSIQIKTSDKEKKINFYTALYHSKVVPNIINDVNGQYRMNNDSIGVLPHGQKQYSTLSIWDIYRSWEPLMTIIDTPLVVNIINSMLRIYKVTGELPIWPLSSGETHTMIGYHSVAIISDAYMKGLKGFDADLALKAMIESANKNRKGASLYVKYGYIPCNIKSESVSCHLEFAYDDWCIARMAQKMGKNDIANEFYKRSLSYVNIFDPLTALFRGKRDDGNWENPFEPFKITRDFTEANAWQYRFATVYDVNGLIQEYGSKQRFVSQLDSLFRLDSSLCNSDIPDVTGLIGQYAHGNEPSHHIAYLYSYVDEPWKTQEKVRYILEKMYQSTPDGICGNEDCGQMSAWYILSSIGLYQVCPGSNEFLFSSPVFDEISIELSNGKKLEIRANNPSKNKYIQSVEFNGTVLNESYINYDNLMNGGKLVFHLTNKPNVEAFNKGKKPYSLTYFKKVSIPFINKDLNLFKDSIQVDLNCMTKDAEIRYTLDGTTPNEFSSVYKFPLMISNSAILKAIAYKEGYAPSDLFSINIKKGIPLKSEKINGLKNGVHAYYSEGVYKSCHELDKKKSISHTIMSSPNINNSPNKDHFGYIFEGYIYIPITGKYTFQVTSDDGSILIINDKEVVNNDGSHAAVSTSGSAVLEKGYHKYTLLYFEDYEGEYLQWKWKTPLDDNFTEIPVQNLFIK